MLVNIFLNVTNAMMQKFVSLIEFAVGSINIPKMFNYSLFAGQKVFPNAEEILSILSQAFDEPLL